MTPPPLKLRWTGLLLAYARERLTPDRLLPAVLLVVIATLAGKGWTGPAALAADTVLALALVVTFRIWDDLMDRERDRSKHPDRVVVRAPSTDPLVLATGALLTVAQWTIADRQGLQSVALLFVYMIVLAASYRLRGSRTATTDRILLLKYGMFTLALIGFPAAWTPRGLLSAAAAFLIACIHEWWHDPESPVLSFGGSR
jgi:4-hydroxybenzoate polyprenyltransferase